MSAGVTFGSFGDMITLSIIIKDLVKALDDSRGSSAEYQEVIRELWALDRVLLEVELLWRTCESTVQLNALRETARRMADQCRQSIDAFLKKVQKFGPSLRDGGSGSIVRDAAMKIRWQATQAHELSKFRAEINAHCSAINMLLVTANVNLATLNDERLHARLALNEGRIEASSNEQQLLLKDLNAQLEENNKQIRAGNAVTHKISEALRLDWVRQLGNDLKTYMRKIFLINVATYKAIIDIRRCLPSHLERSLYQEPFLLEDAIGRVAPVHMQFISSWKAFDLVLELRFENMQGYRMVQNKEYVIQESATRREIGRSKPWEASFLPGQKVVMSMLFNDSTSSTSSCPRCHKSTDRPRNSDVQCAECGMWYRRITEYNDIDPPPPTSQMPVHKPREEVVVFGQTSFSKVIFGPKPPENLSASKKRKRDEIQNDDDIALFKRVRVLSKKTRVRRIKQISGPFTRLATVSNGFTETSINAAHENNRPTSGSATPKQSSKRTLMTEHSRDLTAISVPSAPLNTIPVPRTGDTPDMDDSDDDLNDSDHRENHSEDDDKEYITSLPLEVSEEDHSLSDQDESGSLDGQERYSFEVPASHTESSSTLFRPRYRRPSPTSKERQLHKAIIQDVSFMVFRLLDAGANAECHWERKPLSRAIEIGNEMVIGKLLVEVADVNKSDVAGWRALMRVAEKGDTEVFELLLSHGANFEAKKYPGDTALQLAAAKGHIEIVRRLLDYGATILTDARAENTEIQRVIAKGHAEVVRLLLERGADMVVKDAHGLTLLRKAALEKRKEIFQLLVQNGAYPEVRDKYGRSAQALWKDTNVLPNETTTL